jgi:hypothetical protein
MAKKVCKARHAVHGGDSLPLAKEVLSALTYPINLSSTLHPEQHQPADLHPGPEVHFLAY